MKVLFLFPVLALLPALVLAQEPRMEAKSELFELVATLKPDELSVMIDRYATNEPVLKARLEIESGGLKAKAKFHAEHGDYSVDDKAMLALLAKPGAHALVFTVTAGDEADLLDGQLDNDPKPTEVLGHSHGEAAQQKPRWLLWAGLPLLLLGTLAVIARRNGVRA